MKSSPFIPLAAILFLTATGCDRRSAEVAEKLAALERQNAAAANRQAELERQIEDQKLAAERDAIERERLRIEDDLAALERKQGEATAAQEEAIRRREEALAEREETAKRIQSDLVEKEETLQEKQQQLSERDRELAGREALDFQAPERSEPVGDYGMFHDSLSSYGSWFETPDYGYVWQPVVVRDSDWRPYSRGRWVCSDRGWTWISDEPFGWATYHYGRWALLRGRGWIWVPGTEWAPSWVSWRENDRHIGWAPLPPETLAYRGHAWDSTVDVQFGISAACFTFVEISHFADPIYARRLPVSRNDSCFRETTNITYIHIEKNQVICGGPGYKRLSDRARKPLPFYRLEIDSHPTPARDRLGLRPRIKGNHLVVSAPNLESKRNESLKPKRIKGRIDDADVERSGALSGEISSRYRRSREEARERAGLPAIVVRQEKRVEEARVEAQQVTERRPDRPQVLAPREQVRREPLRIAPQEISQPDEMVEESEELAVGDRQEQAETADRQEMEQERERGRTEERQDQVRRDGQEQDQKRRRQEQARQAEQDAMRRRQEEQAQEQRRQEKQREAEAREQERAQRRAQEEDRQRQQERAERQQKEESLREEERGRQRQEQEQSRRKEQEDQNQRQRQEESRKSQEKDRDEDRKKGR